MWKISWIFPHEFFFKLKQKQTVFKQTIIGKIFFPYKKKSVWIFFHRLCGGIHTIHTLGKTLFRTKKKYKAILITKKL